MNKLINKYILDFEIENEKKLIIFCKYFRNNIDEGLETLARISSIYMISGSSVVQQFLIDLCFTNISLKIKVEAVKSLEIFEEFEEIIKKKDSNEIKIMKEENNQQIKLRNEKRMNKFYEILNHVLSEIEKEIINSKSYSENGELSITYIIDLICTLSQSKTFENETIQYLNSILNNENIDCEYRYNKILSLEKKLSNQFIKSICFVFINNSKNRTLYRILSGQYLLQLCQSTDDEKIIIQDIILSFANDTELDYNLRADATDILLNLGTDEYKVIGRELIQLLGNIEGNVKTIYDDKQNVHATKIEDSVMKMLTTITSYKTLKINEIEIDYNYVFEEIKQLLNDVEILQSKDEKSCKYCNKITDETFCSTKCNKYFKIIQSLKRIEADRKQYLNLLLTNILVKLWSYIQTNDFCEEMVKRLLEELEEMSGTCSTGFVSRLLNSVSGFGGLNITISYSDQLVANFIGRLNAYTKKIIEPNSLFVTNEKILFELIELIVNKNNHLIKIKIHLGKNKYLSKEQLVEKIKTYLESDKDSKINDITMFFYEQVLNEMAVENSKFAERQYFNLFFRAYLPNLRQELYEEFNEFMSDSEFDLNIRKCISMYDGLQHFV